VPKVHNGSIRAKREVSVVRTRSIAAAVVVFLGALTGLLAMPGTAAAQSGYSTKPRHAEPTSNMQTAIKAINVGHHSGFDRVVFVFNGPQPGYDVAYQAKITSDPSGKPVTLKGSAFLHVSFRLTSTVTPAPQGTINANLPMVKQIKGAGDFEAVTAYGIGVASKAPFKVFKLASPNRVVIDVETKPSTLPKTGSGLPYPLMAIALMLIMSGVVLRAATQPNYYSSGFPS
jgi:hypothetical protein